MPLFLPQIPFYCWNDLIYRSSWKPGWVLINGHSCVCAVDKDVRWVKVFCHDFQLKWAFPPRDWWPRWPSGSPLCCFCREINKWAFDRQLSNFLFIQCMFAIVQKVAWNQLKQCRWRIFGGAVSLCLAAILWAASMFPNVCLIQESIWWLLKLSPDQMKSTTQCQPGVTPAEWTGPTFGLFWKRWWIPKFSPNGKMSLWTRFVKCPISLFKLLLPGWETKE